MLLSQINDIILLIDMYSSLTFGVNLIDDQSALRLISSDILILIIINKILMN